MPNPTLTNLPAEIRQLIFEALFRSTTIKKGFNNQPPNSSYHTGILLVCRSLYHEARPLMVQNITLSFASDAQMLRWLLKMSLEDISDLRYMSIKTMGLTRIQRLYNTQHVLSLIPGIQLNMLNIDVGPTNSSRGAVYRTYIAIDEMIQTNGWKSLQVSSDTGGTAREDYRDLIPSQPRTWNSILRARDGEQSGAECKLYDPSGEVLEWPDPGKGFRMTVHARRGDGATYVTNGHCTEELFKHKVASSLHQLQEMGLHLPLADRLWHEDTIKGRPGSRIQNLEPHLPEGLYDVCLEAMALLIQDLPDSSTNDNCHK